MWSIQIKPFYRVKYNYQFEKYLYYLRRQSNQILQESNTAKLCKHNVKNRHINHAKTEYIYNPPNKGL